MRKAFTTTVDTEISKMFKIKCAEQSKTMSEVLEAFMIAYAHDQFELNEEKTLSVSVAATKVTHKFKDVQQIIDDRQQQEILKNV